MMNIQKVFDGLYLHYNFSFYYKVHPIADINLNTIIDHRQPHLTTDGVASFRYFMGKSSLVG